VIFASQVLVIYDSSDDDDSLGKQWKATGAVAKKKHLGDDDGDDWVKPHL
jgi:hypothetical protein